jgi:hypothetical protein
MLTMGVFIECRIRNEVEIVAFTLGGELAATFFILFSVVYTK